MNKFPLWGILAGTVVWLAGLILSGCQTTDRIQPEAKKDSVVLYTTGQLLDPKTRQYRAVYWEQAKIHHLELGIARETGCYGLLKQGHNLYITGYYVDPDDERSKPCYWLNGRKIDLPVPVDQVYDRAAVRDVQWFQNALYLLGDIDLRPVLWKIQPGFSPKLIVLKGFSNAVAGGELGTGNLALHKNQLFIGGIQVLNVDGQIVSHPGYWTVDQHDTVQFEEIDSKPVRSLAFSILPTDQGIFIAGERNDTRDRSAPQPTLWKNGNRFQFSQAVNPASQRLHEMAIDSRGQLYLNILDYHRFLPIIWQVNPSGNVTEIILSIPSGATRAFCHNLAMANDRPYYSGTYELNGKYHGCYWHGNQRTDLETIEGGFQTLARMIAVPFIR